MNDVVNLRIARKRAKRRRDEAAVATQRVAHGVPKAARERAKMERERAERALDRHKTPDGDGA